MATHTHSAQTLIEKIRSLPTDRIAEVEDLVDFLKERLKHQNTTATRKRPLEFPVISVGHWPEDLSLRRKDIYGDDGR